MWLNQIHQMSVGPLWLLREPTLPPESPSRSSVCPSCGAPWLQTSAAEVDRVVVLDEPLGAAPTQMLLNNCLRAAGWHQVAWLPLHRKCGTTDSALQALQQAVLENSSMTILVLGTAATQTLDPQLQRGKPGQYHGALLIATHHPQQLLIDPALKAEVWSDLCLAIPHVP